MLGFSEFARSTTRLATAYGRLLLILIDIGNVGRGRERFTPYQSEDPSPTIPTHRMKEEKGKTVEDKRGATGLGQ